MNLTPLQLLILSVIYLIILGEIALLVRIIVAAFKGAPYAATDEETLREILAAVKLKKGEKVVDVGSGDGKIVLALAKKGYTAYGIELNPLLVWWTRWQIRKQGLQGKAFIYRRDMWKEDMSQYDVIIVYQITYVMKRLEKKLRAEIKPGTRVISNYFTFPTWKPKKKKGRLSIYTR